jgi:arylsulfatase A-like enzyme
VLLISLDACRADHLSCYGYSRKTSPFLDQLAAEGLLFTNAFVNTHGTPPSHTTIFSSLYQETHRVEYNVRPGFAHYRVPNEVNLLPEHLQRHGYTTIGVTGGGWLGRQFGYSRGFSTFDDQPTPRVGAGRLAKLVRRKAQTGRPIFAFLHTYEIHSPHAPPSPYRTLWGRFPTRIEGSDENLKAINAGRLRATESDVRALQAMYDGEIRYTDDVLREMFTELAGLGFFRNALVVVTADHGEELGERGAFLHGDRLYDDLVHVPLILRGTGVPRGKVDPNLASSIDIAPTILAAAGIRADALLEGRDLLTAPAADAVFAQLASRHYSIRTHRWKLIENTEPWSLELYDLQADPREHSNVADRFPHEAQALHDRLRAWRQSRPSLRFSDPPPVELSEETRERLHALGYLDGR